MACAGNLVSYRSGNKFTHFSMKQKHFESIHAKI